MKIWLYASGRDYYAASHLGDLKAVCFTQGEAMAMLEHFAEDADSDDAARWACVVEVKGAKFRSIAQAHSDDNEIVLSDNHAFWDPFTR